MLKPLTSLALLALAVAGCAPLAGAGTWLIAVVALAWLAVPSRTQAGPPLPRPKCSGSETKQCSNGRITYHCCPANAKCNYAYAPFVECGYESCVPGQDLGRCPVPRTRSVPAKNADDCNVNHHGRWEKACIDRKVTMACIPGVPTNFSGPAFNPPFKTCGPDQCTTSRYVEDCYPTKAEATSCPGGWTTVCLQGRLEERCVPAATSLTKTVTGKPVVSEFVRCGEQTCAMGTDKAACGR